MDIRYGVCIGFFQGVVAEFEMNRSRQGKLACHAAQTNLGQAIDAIEGYAKRHPETLQANAEILIEGAMKDLGHCD